MTLAPNVHVLAHDASTKRLMGYTKIGTVEIERDVFVGAGSIILPGVKIGEQAIIGAGSIVTKSVPKQMVYAGNPAKAICTVAEYRDKNNDFIKDSLIYGDEYSYQQITSEKKIRMRNELANRIGFIR